MRRREFIAGMAGVAVWPLAAYAQQPKAPAVVGLLNAVSFDGPYAKPAEAIRQGLRAAGFVEGANLAINLAPRKVTTIVCRTWRRTSFAARWR